MVCPKYDWNKLDKTRKRDEISGQLSIIKLHFIVGNNHMCLFRKCFEFFLWCGQQLGCIFLLENTIDTIGPIWNLLENKAAHCWHFAFFVVGACEYWNYYSHSCGFLIDVPRERVAPQKGPQNSMSTSYLLLATQLQWAFTLKINEALTNHRQLDQIRLWIILSLRNEGEAHQP